MSAPGGTTTPKSKTGCLAILHGRNPQSAHPTKHIPYKCDTLHRRFKHALFDQTYIFLPFKISKYENRAFKKGSLKYVMEEKKILHRDQKLVLITPINST